MADAFRSPRRIGDIVSLVSHAAKIVQKIGRERKCIKFRNLDFEVGQRYDGLYFCRAETVI